MADLIHIIVAAGFGLALATAGATLALRSRHRPAPPSPRRRTAATLRAPLPPTQPEAATVVPLAIRPPARHHRAPRDAGDRIGAMLIELRARRGRPEP